MAQWSKNFTPITSVNNGNEYKLIDTPTLDMFNVPMNNTQYLYEHYVDKDVTFSTYNSKITNSGTDISLKTRDTSTGDSFELLVAEDDIYVKYVYNGEDFEYGINARFDGIDENIESIQQRLTALGFKYPPTTQQIPLLVGGTNVLTIYVSAGANGDRTKTSREGNRTLLKIQVNMLSGYSANPNFENFYRYGYEATTSQAIPEVYRPNVAQEFYIPSGRVEYRRIVQSTSYATTLTLPIKITLGTDGIFKAQILSTNTPIFPSQMTFDYYYSNGNTIQMSIGYTNAPIS